MLRRVHLRHIGRRGAIRCRRDRADSVLATNRVGVCGSGLCEVLLGLRVLLLLGLLGYIGLLLLHVLLLRLLLLDRLSILLLGRLLRLHWSGIVVVFLHGHGLVIAGAVLGWGLRGVCGGAVGGGLAVLVPCDEEDDCACDPRDAVMESEHIMCYNVLVMNTYNSTPANVAPAARAPWYASYVVVSSRFDSTTTSRLR
jgi:hypothetical protein